MQLRNGKQSMPYKQEKNEEDIEEVEVNEIYSSLEYSMFQDDSGLYYIVNYEDQTDYEHYYEYTDFNDAKNKYIELTNNDYTIEDEDYEDGKKNFKYREEDNRDVLYVPDFSSLKYKMVHDDYGNYYILNIGDYEDVPIWELINNEDYEDVTIWCDCFDDAKIKFIELTNNDYTIEL